MSSNKETPSVVESDLSPTSLPEEFVKGEGKFCPHAGVLSRGSGMFQEQGRVLLLNRLRMASLILAFGSGAFLLRGLLLGEYHEVHGRELLQLEALLTGTLFTISGLLWMKPCFCLWRLRICEGITFGAPAAFFIWMQFSELCACDPDLISKLAFAFPLQTVLPWMILIYTYGFFIPNSLRGVSTVTSLMIISPIAGAVMTGMNV
ncbi:MAG: hypothetical protein QM501_07025, partial [Gimesia sp.]